MGKVINYLTLLIFIDILFLATGQICTEPSADGQACTLTSVIFNAILNLKDITLSDFFSELIGGALNLFNSGTGIAALLVTGGVIVGAFFASREITVLFIPIAFTLALIASDFVIIGAYLISLSPLLALMIMAPLSIIYIFTIVEWLRGKD